jgi:hypothetical protein
MVPRAEFHAMLEDILGTENVYFQPPVDKKMVYPCIRYELDDVDVEHADNIPWRSDKRYLVTIIDRNPDSAIPDKVAALPMCSFSRHYRASGLNHHVFNLFPS